MLSVSFRRPMRGAEDARQLLGFGEQRGDVGRGALNPGVGQPLQPEHRFVGFLGDDAELGDELGVRARPARRAVIGRGRRGRVLVLPGRSPRHRRVWKPLHQPNRQNGERIGPHLKLVGLTHADNWCKASARVGTGQDEPMTGSMLQ